MQVISTGYFVRVIVGEETKNDKGHSVKQENLASVQVKYAYLDAVREQQPHGERKLHCFITYL